MKVNKRMVLDMHKVATPGCCSADSLVAFQARLKRYAHPIPEWIWVQHNHYKVVYEGMINVLEFCGCKLIVLGEYLNDSYMWMVILNAGHFTLGQRRLIGSLSGQWHEVFKNNPIFVEPFVREDVLAYAALVNSDFVWQEALKTGVLVRHDVVGLAKMKASWQHRSLCQCGIKTGLLPAQEALCWLSSLNNYAVDAAVAYVQQYKIQGQELFSLETMLEKAKGEKSMQNFWIPILQSATHGLTRQDVLNLAEKYRSSEALLVAVIRSGMLGKADCEQIRKSSPSQAVFGALLELQAITA
jgi:hypothetical protein